MVFWFAPDGWFDLTTLGPFVEEDFACWCCAMGHFSDFLTQKFLEPVLTVASSLPGLKGETKSIQ